MYNNDSYSCGNHEKILTLFCNIFYLILISIRYSIKGLELLRSPFCAGVIVNLKVTAHQLLSSLEYSLNFPFKNMQHDNIGWLTKVR